MKKEKGCVYFFKHVGLSPIKIGYSESESPIDRFNQFKTYCPFGAELIGFIRTENPNELEILLHQKFSRDRLKGEWFEISKDEALKCIQFYSNLEDIEETNKFQISWAKKIAYKSDSSFNKLIEFNKKFSLEETENCKAVYYNQKELSLIFDTDKKNIANFFKENNIERKAYRINGLLKKCYKIYQNI
jgi:hypothetical protein